MSTRSKVVPLNLKRKASADGSQNNPSGNIRASEAAKPLNAVCEDAVGQLSQHLANFFDHVDDVFFELADRAATHNDQKLYFESMRALRQAKDDITFGTLKSIRELFDQLSDSPVIFERPELSHPHFSEGQNNMTLVKEPDVFEAKMAIDGMVLKSLKHNSRVLSHLSLRIDGLLHHVDVDDNSNPLGPAAICDSFQRSFNQHAFNVKVILIVYKLFDKYVLSQLKSVYEKANQRLIDFGVLPNVSHEPAKEEFASQKPLARNQADQKQVFKMLQQLLARQTEQQKVQAVHKNQQPQLKRSVLLKALHFLQQQSYEQGVIIQLADQGDVLQRVVVKDVVQQVLGVVTRTSLARKSGVKISADMIEVADRDIIRLVSMLFDYIFSDKQIPYELKHLIGYLHIPLVRVALMTPDFFNRSEHEARRLVNHIASISHGWNIDQPEGNKRILVIVQRVVKRVLAEFKNDARIFNDIVARYLLEYEKEMKQCSLKEKQTYETEKGRARALAAQQAVDFSVGQRLQTCELTEPLDVLVRLGWSQVLYLIWLRSGGESQEWQEGLQTLEQLVWSLGPKATQLDRDRLVELLPALLKALQAGLVKSSFNPFDLNRAFSELERVHIESICQVGDSSLQSVPEYVSPERDDWAMKPYDESEWLAQEIKEHQAKNIKAIQSIYRQHECFRSDAISDYNHGEDINISLALSSLENEPTAYESLHEAARNMDEQWYLRVDHLREGDWLTFETPSGQPYSVKLAVILPQQERFVFVNRYGEKLFEKNREQLAVGLKLQHIKIVDNNPMFDRALDQLINKLDKNR